MTTRSGFTLIEVMIYLAISSTILITAVFVGQAVIETSQKAIILAQIEQEGDLVLALAEEKFLSGDQIEFATSTSWDISSSSVYTIDIPESAVQHTNASFYIANQYFSLDLYE